MKKNITVSAIVASYNPKLFQLKRTILSLLLQKGVELQIIICDDGSESTYFPELTELFKEHGFSDYLLLTHENMGTCRNVYDGLCRATGKYAKLISPGDYLYEEDTLEKWTRYMEDNSVKASFCDSVYYCENPQGELKIYSVKTNPRLRRFFLKDRYREKAGRINYLLNLDTAVGAAFLTDTKLLKKYMKDVLGKLILFEDLTYCYMLYAGEKIYYYPAIGIWYEFGTGVSTGPEDEKMLARIAREQAGLYRVLSETKLPADAIGLKARRFLSGIPYKNRIAGLWNKYGRTPLAALLRLVQAVGGDKTPTDVNYDFYNLLSSLSRSE